MKSNILKIIFCYFLILGCSVFAQKKHELLYNKGNEAFANQDYRAADSLFTLSIKLNPQPNSYFNRAACRIKLNDYEGYCVDLKNASALKDNEANNLYCRQCIMQDTIYKKKDGSIVTKEEAEIIEYNLNSKYNTDFDYEKRDTSGLIIVSRARVNEKTFYRSCKEVKPATYIGGRDSLTNYIKSTISFFNECQSLGNAVFLSLEAIIDEKGEMSNVEILDYSGGINTGELIGAIKRSQQWKPAIYRDRIVRFQLRLSILYYEGKLSLYSNSFNDGDPAEDKMSEYYGGAKAMMMFVAKNIIYPQTAKEAGITGQCILKFIVLPNGKITNIEIAKGVPNCSECDQEAINVVKMMPKWKPATQNGKPVPMYFNLPINFILK